MSIARKKPPINGESQTTSGGGHSANIATPKVSAGNQTTPAMTVIVIARTGMSPRIAPILFFPLLADALLTLFYRARRGRSLLVAHAEHIYQIAIIAGWSHARIAVTYWSQWLSAALWPYWFRVTPRT